MVAGGDARAPSNREKFYDSKNIVFSFTNSRVEFYKIYRFTKRLFAKVSPPVLLPP